MIRPQAHPVRSLRSIYPASVKGYFAGGAVLEPEEYTAPMFGCSGVECLYLRKNVVSRFRMEFHIPTTRASRSSSIHRLSHVAHRQYTRAIYTRRDAFYHVRRANDEVNCGICRSRSRRNTSTSAPAQQRPHSMPAPSYEPLPSESDAQPEPQPPSTPQKTRSRLVTVRRILLFAVTITLVSLAAYRSEQWSAGREVVPDLAPDISSGNIEEDVVKEPALPSVLPANDTDMASGGKYSVG